MLGIKSMHIIFGTGFKINLKYFKKAIMIS